MQINDYITDRIGQEEYVLNSLILSKKGDFRMLQTQVSTTGKVVKSAKKAVVGVEKSILEAGLKSVYKYSKNYEGTSIQRSETRLYGLYGAVSEVLIQAGKKDVKAQGVGEFTNRDVSLFYNGNVYNDFIAQSSLTVDILYRNPGDLFSQLRAIEIRAGRNNLAKNIYNNARAITGEAVHFNDLIYRESGIKGNYFTAIFFTDAENKDFSKIVNSALHLYEIGVNTAVVPYTGGEAPEVFLGAVPSEVQLMRVLRGI
jgi:hypothetical protein